MLNAGPIKGEAEGDISESPEWTGAEFTLKNEQS